MTPHHHDSLAFTAGSNLFHLLGLFLVAFLGYTGLFVLVYPLIGTAAAALAILPVVMIAWAEGMWSGVSAGLVVIMLNTLLLRLVGEAGGWLTVVQAGAAPGSLAMLFVALVVGRLRDLTEQNRRQLEERRRVELALRTSERALRKSEGRFRRLVEHAPDIIYSYSFVPKPTLEYVSPQVESVLGYNPRIFYRHPFFAIKLAHPDDRDLIDPTTLPRDQNTISALVRYEHRDGSTIWLDHHIVLVRDGEGRILSMEGYGRDVTQLKRAEHAMRQMTEQLTFQTHHDPLTGLPNRLLFEDRLRQAMLQADQDGEMVAVCYIDVDRFKLINDTYGHQGGDALLEQIAQRLQGHMRQQDTVARVGGDEFAAVLPGLTSAPQMVRLVRRMLELCQQPFEHEAQLLVTTVSIGVSLYPNDGDSVQLLLTRADQALYQAKREGKNGFHLYSNRLNEQTHQRLRLEHDLRRAITQGQLYLHYHPQIDCQSGMVRVMEALARWQHPELGLISPVVFIPIAEETGIIQELGLWVLEEACCQNRLWQQAGLPPVQVSVNVSIAQFIRDDFVEKVEEVLARTGLEARWLELELTESIFLHQKPDTLAKLEQLRAQGVAVAIDDFGTGYSSLRYLQQLSVDTLKLDRSFMDALNVPDPPENATAIITAVVAMARSLGMNMVAEGVTTVQQLAMLRQLGCARVQGYLFTKPLPADAVPTYLHRRPPGT